MRTPFWLSKRWTAYVLTLIALVGAWLFGAPEDVCGALGRAVEYGLPTLLGLESVSDGLGRWQSARKAPTSPGMPVVLPPVDYFPETRFDGPTTDPRSRR